MKTLLQPYLESLGETREYADYFEDFTTNLYKASNGFYKLEFPVWRLPYPKPSFTHSEIKNAILSELKEAKIDYVNYKYNGNQSKIDEINAIDNEEELRNYE